MAGKLWLMFALILLAAGCAGGRTAKTVEYYMLDYAPPVPRGATHRDATLKVERFSVTQLLNNNTMAYRTGSFSLANFPYDRWRTNPGDMVTDFLVRDFRAAGFFRAVFSYHAPEKTRFMLEGTVTDFWEVQEQGNPKALLSLNVTLLDQNQMEISKKVVFQNNYSYGATYEVKSPRGLAQGLSQAMRKLSEQIMSDVHSAVEALDNTRSRRPPSAAAR